MKSDNRYRITWLIRRIFKGMGREAGEYLAEFHVSAADRAIMEFLYPDRALSVPDIAAKYDVSRQHVQVTVNSLLDAELAEKRRNPRHRRSGLVRLTESGKRLFERIRKRDDQMVDELFNGIPETRIRATLRTLEEIHRKLDKGENP